MISKSSFKIYSSCPAHFWFYLHKPEVLVSPALSDFEQMLADQGKKVEQAFYKQYPSLEFVTSKGSEAVEETKELMLENVVRIAQVAFEAGGFFAQSDMIEVQESGKLHLYEIKSSSSMQNMGIDDGPAIPSKEEHMADIAFQYEVITKAGYDVEKMFLVEVNKLYTRSGDPDPAQLFTVNDVTKEVLTLLPKIRIAMDEALSFSTSSEQPGTCDCKYKSRKNQCAAFAYLHPEWSDYAVFDLVRIGSSLKRLRDLVDHHYVLVKDIPANYKLLDAHFDQVVSWNENREIIRREDIDRTLNSLSYPLYFLDYETVSAAIPLFETTRPYQHIPFQYSMHILREKDAAVEHFEFLHTDTSSPVHAVIHRLREDISDSGTIIVWNETFESKCHTNLAELIPDAAPFLIGLNDRMFDLMDIFSKRMYVHRDFKGSFSIKKVLPVLVPDLSYEHLEVSDGGKAMSEWLRMIYELEDAEQKAGIQKQLLEYCKLDTLAMVRIYEWLLYKIISV